MRKWLLSCLVLFASAGFAQTWQTSFVQTSFVTNVVVSNSSGSDQVTLVGNLAAIVQVLIPSDPCAPQIPNDPCRAVPIRIAYAALASGVGQPTGATYSALSAATVQGTFSMPGTFPWTFGLRFTAPSPIIPPTPLTLTVAANINSQGTATAVAVPSSGLVSWWQAEGNALDALRRNNGSLGEVVNFVPGQVGRAFSFGEQGYVQVAPSSSLQPANVTAMAWVRHLGAPGDDNYVLAQGGQGCTAASYAMYTGSGNLNFYVFDGGTFVESPDSGPGVWDGNWHFVVGTYDGQFVRLYVDGVQAGNGTPVTAPISYALQYKQFNIGAYRGTCELRFNGDIDEVQIFNRALSANEIAGTFNSLSATASVANNGLQSVTPDQLQAAINAGTAQATSSQIIQQQSQAQAAVDAANQAFINNYLQLNPQLTSLARLVASDPQPSSTFVPAGSSWKVPVPSLGTSMFTMGRSQKLAAIFNTIQKANDPAVQLGMYTNLYNSLPAAYLQSFTTDLGLLFNPPVSPASLANASLDQITQAIGRLASDWQTVNSFVRNLPVGDVPCYAEFGVGGWVGAIGDENGPYPSCDGNTTTTFSPYGIMANFDFPLKHSQSCIKWQGNRNTCHIFANTSAMEMMVAESTGLKVNLSEQDFMEHYRGFWYPHFQDDGGNVWESATSAMNSGYSFPYENKRIYNPSFLRTADTTTVTITLPPPFPPNTTFNFTYDTAYHHSCDYYSWWCSDSGSQAPLMCSNLSNYPGCAFYDPGVPGSGYRITGVDDNVWHFENLDLSMSILLLELAVHHGVVLGVNVTPNFFNAGNGVRFPLNPHPGFVVYDPADTSGSTVGHVVHVIGYISDQDLHAKLPNAPSTNMGWFIVKNSWSRCWGDNGYGYIAWDYLKNQTNGGIAINGISY